MSVAVESPRTRPRTATALLLALVPALIVLSTSLLIGGLAGKPDALGAVRTYQVVMDAAVLLRFFGMFVSVITVWGLLRSRSSPRWLLAVAVLSGPIAYALTAAFEVARFFPPGPAAYYGLNPMFVAAVGGQLALAAVSEMLWRWRQRSRGDRNRSVVTWRLVAVVVLGLAVVFFTVLWRGGVPFFFWYQRGYLLLFT